MANNFLDTANVVPVSKITYSRDAALRTMKNGQTVTQEIMPMAISNDTSRNIDMPAHFMPSFVPNVSPITSGDNASFFVTNTNGVIVPPLQPVQKIIALGGNMELRALAIDVLVSNGVVKYTDLMHPTQITAGGVISENMIEKDLTRFAAQNAVAGFSPAAIQFNTNQPNTTGYRLFSFPMEVGKLIPQAYEEIPIEFTPSQFQLGVEIVSFANRAIATNLMYIFVIPGVSGQSVLTRFKFIVPTI